MPHHPSDNYYEYPSGIIVCGECLDSDLAKTSSGEYTGDEAVRIGLFTRVQGDQTNPMQCDSCLKQNAAYDDLGEEP